MKPTVLFVGAFPPPGSAIAGGIVTSCRHLLASDLPTWYDLVLLDSTQRSIPEPGVLTRSLLAARRLVRFIHLFERRRPQAVLAFSSQGGSFVEKCACAAYARMRGVPTVLLMRGGPFMDDVRASAHYRTFARLLLRSVTVLPCQTARWQAFFRDELGIDAAKLPVIHNWTAPADYLSLTRRPDDSAQRPVHLLFLAWVDRAKGIFELLDAVAGLARDAALPPVMLHVAGGGAHVAAVREAIAHHGLGHQVVLDGWVTGDAKRALYEAADIFVLPSYAEGLPNSMIEAMAVALPVVVTAVGGIPDAIRHGENGLLVPPRDAEALRLALAQLVASAPLRRTLGEAARVTARTTFSLAQGADALRAALDLAIATQASARTRSEPPGLDGV